MIRISLALLAIFTGVNLGRAQDDEEPKLLDIKLSDWIKRIDEGKTVKDRRRGILAVEQIGYSRSRQVIPALIKPLRVDKEAEVRVAAARALGRAMAKANAEAREDKKDELPKFETAREALITALRLDKDAAVREAAAAALGDVGADARQAASALGVALKDKEVSVVRAAASALRRMGKDAKEASRDLQSLLADKAADLEARLDAVVALGVIRDDLAVLDIFKEIVADPKADPRLRRATAEAIGKFGKDGAVAATVFRAVLISKDTPKEVKEAILAAIDALGNEGKPAIAGLVATLSDEDRGLRCLAMQALAKLNRELGDSRKEVIQAVTKNLDDSNSEVIVTALDTLGTLASEGLVGESDEVVKRIDAVYNREGKKLIREAAQAAREKIRPTKKQEK
ncbi:MAG: HEAT repeat domain-containing protein [Gemmataceae bacterium]